MEVRVDLDEELVDELDEEARLQGFDDRAAYLRWIVAHRPMSELATTQAPAVASRVSELEERVKLLERQLDLDQPVDPDADLGSGSSSGGSLGGGSAGGGLDDEPTGGGLEPSEESSGASLDDVDTATESMDLAEPEDAGGGDDEKEAGDDEKEAGDDDIAEAIGDVEIEDDEDENGGDGVDGD